MSVFIPVNNLCLNCGKEVSPLTDRQEIAFDDQDRCRRRCGKCIGKLVARMPISNTTGHMDPGRKE